MPSAARSATEGAAASASLVIEHTIGQPGWPAALTGTSAPLAALAACFVQPRKAFALRALWHLRNLRNGGWQSVDAAALRLAVRLPRKLSLRNVKVDVRIDARAGTQRFRFPLRTVRGSEPGRTAPEQRWLVFALAPRALTEFAQARASFAALGAGDRLTIRVSDASPPSGPSPLHVELLFDPRDGYFPLLAAPAPAERLKRKTGSRSRHV
jgi:hypothetical protein